MKKQTTRFAHAASTCWDPEKHVDIGVAPWRNEYRAALIEASRDGGGEYQDADREEIVEDYRASLNRKFADGVITEADIRSLKGRTLFGWHKADAEVLIAAAERMPDADEKDEAPEPTYETAAAKMLVAMSEASGDRAKAAGFLEGATNLLVVEATKAKRLGQPAKRRALNADIATTQEAIRLLTLEA